jgi:hypothetical protein
MGHMRVYTRSLYEGTQDHGCNCPGNPVVLTIERPLSLPCLAKLHDFCLSPPVRPVSSFLFYFYFWYLLAEPSGPLSLFISAHTPLPFSPPSPITLFFIPLSHKTMLTLESSCYGPISHDLTSKTEGTIPSLLSSSLVVQSNRRLPLPLRPLCRLESNRVIPFLLLFSRVGLYRGLSPRAILCLFECCTVLLS